MDQRVHNIYECFEQHIAASANSDAVVDGAKRYTYQQLANFVDQYADCLIGNGVSPGDIVPVVLDRSIEAIASMLAIFKVGGIFVPIDLMSKKQSIEKQLFQVSAKLVISNHEGQALLKTSMLKITVISVDEINTLSNPGVLHDTKMLELDSCAYITFTSGSTGAPKGVCVSHANLLSTFNSWLTIYRLNEITYHLQMANFSFDVFIGDVARSLFSGGCIVLCPSNYLAKPRNLCELINEENIEFAEFVPSTLRKLLTYTEKHHCTLNTLKILVCGSDAWTYNEYCRAQKMCNHSARVINSYGLTETTIDNSYFEKTSTDHFHLSPSDYLPIGKPMMNCQFTLLNELQKPVPIGEVGEIYISGPSVSLGYFENSALTKRHFVYLVSQNTSERFYRTYDRAKRLADGSYVLVGRCDEKCQSKIVPSTIEMFVNDHPQIEQAVVILEKKFLRTISHCFFKSDSPVEYTHLINFLSGKLPILYTPDKYYRVESIATTRNGKVSKKLSDQQILEQVTGSVRHEIELVAKKAFKQFCDLVLQPVVITKEFFAGRFHSMLAASANQEVSNES